MKIIVDITEDEIDSLGGCIQVAESEGHTEDETWKTIRKIREAFQQKDAKINLQEMYVDHLTTDLEKRSIGGILDFLAQYCGWKELFAYVSKKVA